MLKKTYKSKPNCLISSFLPKTIRIDSPYDAVFFKVVYSKIILDSVTYWNGFPGDELNLFMITLFSSIKPTSTPDVEVTQS